MGKKRGKIATLIMSISNIRMKVLWDGGLRFDNWIYGGALIFLYLIQ